MKHRVLVLILSLLICACSTQRPDSVTMTTSSFNKNPLFTADNSQHYLTWDKALTASILLNKDYPFGQHMDAYTALYHPDIVNLYQQDEALLALKKIKLRRHWLGDIEQQGNPALRLKTSVTLAAYDNQRQAFPIHAVAPTTPEHSYHYKFSKVLAKDSSFPEHFYLYISNIKQLTQLKLEPELARLLTNNNIQQGHINSLPIDIEIQINQVAGNQGQGLGAVMTRVIFYSDEDREVPLRIDSFSVADNNQIK